MALEKVIVLDTNVLIEDAHAIGAFEGSRVIIPVMVLEELDKIKSESSFRGRNAREAIRVLDELRSRGPLSKGVTLENGTTVQIALPEEGITLGTITSSADVDNQILRLIQELKKKYEVELVSKDINLRVKADALGIHAVDFKEEYVDELSIYKGWTTVEIPAVQLKQEIPDDLYEIHKKKPFINNEFIIAGSVNNPYNNRLFRYKGRNEFISVPMQDLKWSIQPRNIQQRMALDLLFDNDIKLVTLIGPAGTGKTFLALVAALHEVLIYENYERMLVTRPVVPLGPDIGYLPGDVREKLHTWMQPIYDNMDYILHSAQSARRSLGVYHGEEEEHGKGKFKKKKSVTGLVSLDELIANGRVSLEAITYMRGRSIPYQFIIIDEVQNLTPHEIKTLVSRVGEGSKVILTGDPYQIDAPHLDFSNNGLVVVSERFKGESIFGTVYLETTERSELSRLAAQLL